MSGGLPLSFQLLAFNDGSEGSQFTQLESHLIGVHCSSTLGLETHEASLSPLVVCVYQGYPLWETSF